MYKLMSVVTFILFILIEMFNAADATSVYVIGSPTDFPEYNKKLRVKIRVVNRPSNGYVLVELNSTSAMFGRCTNYPILSQDATADLQLLKADNIGDEWNDLGTGVLKYKFPYSYENTHEFDVYVRCYDYGAWGTLKAVVYKDRFGPDQKLDSNIGTVPRDENNNHIADGWKNDFYPYIWSDETNKQVNVSATRGQDGIKDYLYSVPMGADRQQTVDKETGPNTNSENGDGLTDFEEYRGLMTEQYGGYGGGATGHTRTDPETKDVFCVVHASLSSYGMGDVSRHPSHSFTELHRVCVSDPFGSVRDANHVLNRNASRTCGWLNSNSSGIPDKHYVYAVRVQDGTRHPTETSYLGLAPASKPIYLPLANIYIDTIQDFQKKRLTGKSVSEITRAIIAHEIGHMINLNHCPQGCLDNIKGKCLMFPSATRRDENGNLVANIDSSPSSHHYGDYDLADPVKSPQTPGTIQNTNQVETPNDFSPMRTLTPSGGNYTAEAGDSHTANFSTSSAYSSVYWYVQRPSDTQTSVATQEIDQGDGSLTTADFTYTFPSGVSGDYVFSVYVYDGDNTTIYEESYTVSVTTSSSTSPQDDSGGTPLGTLGSSTTTTVAAGATAYIEYMTQGGDCYNTIIWYITPPSGSETYGDHIYGYGTVNQAFFNCPIQNDAMAGTWTFRLEVNLYPSGSYEDTFTNTVTD